MSFESSTSDTNEGETVPRPEVEELIGEFIAIEEVDEHAERIAQNEVARAKAMVTASLLLVEAGAVDKENPHLSRVDAGRARALLATLKWDRNVVDINSNDAERFSHVPDEIKEAQRLVYERYAPTAEMESLQSHVFQNALESKIGGIEADIDAWKSSDREKRQHILQNYAQEISAQFGVDPTVEIFFAENQGGESVAAYVEGSGKILWPQKTLDTKSMFQCLEIVAHEVNHANQEHMLKSGSPLSDAEWFNIANERSAFIATEEFKGKGDSYKKKSNYLSIPQEKDAFNAQQIFKTLLGEQAALALEKRLSELGLPDLAVSRDMCELASLYEVLGDDISETDISRLKMSQKGKAYLDHMRGTPDFVEVACKEAARIEGVMRTNFKGIF